MSESIIHTQDLSKQYGDFWALQNLNMEIPSRSVVGFLGPNGAGKSTTIKLLLGLLHPTSGTATIFGQDIQRNSRQIRQRVGYLAQQPRFDPTMTARETLHFVARLFYQGSTQALNARVEEALELVGLSDKADRVVRGFSGGEIQRLGIAQAQINEPELLILDEPAAALDPMGRRDVLTIMERLRERATVFYSTHILDDVQRVSDHVVILNRGQLVAQGSIDTLLQAEEGAVFQVVLRGNCDGARTQLDTLPWVNSIDMEQANGLARWRIGVRDPQQAEEHLLRSILKVPDVHVLEYGRVTYELEDVFMKIVS